ncbi:uncharacterized protein LAESUDRAFT_636580, partial [Laetiporus sulphureus 93-53]
SLTAALTDLMHALAAIGTSLLNSALAVLQFFLALGQELLNGVLQLVHAVVGFGIDLFQTIFGFFTTHFIFTALLLIGGVYYWYTVRGGGAR